jgi:PPK2 family polyphosphate:nucleotide phosphotransferase
MPHDSTIAAPQKISLSKYDPDDTGGMERADADAQIPQLQQRLDRLQDLLYAAQRQSVLVILQGLDTAGKDGTVRHVMAGINPLGCMAYSFKAPSADEASHDFLWRVHRRAPARGMMAIFNRSHYEDVLIVRVHNLVPQGVWRKRYAQINHFEHMLARNDTLILKFFLHISKDEQKRRLLDRERDKDKAWKLSAADWIERQRWEAYSAAYEDALGRCAAEWAPWYVVPANKKWYRNYVVARTIIEQLERHERAWVDELEERGRQELAAVRAARAREEEASAPSAQAP